ncbi:MAG TPA: crossover junction endodeoxyribonuclease RuvC [Rubrobacter sp.]|nr:crossover junction endodeoxyribonuclease RuvC [Rubrobacter sp.]
MATGKGHTILGIDPGTATMGWGVVRQEGSRLRYVQHGAITPPSNWTMPRRLGRLFDGVTQLVEGYRPDTVAVEELFFNTNVTTAITVGQARGVALLAAYRAGIEVAEYTPLQVKQTITSYGRADKRQVQEMVRALLNLREIPRPDDAADGLAIAITHAFSSRISGKVGVGK